MFVSRRDLLLGSLSLPALAAPKAPAAKLNIVLALVDYLPSWMVGCYGSRNVRTPNIDHLALTGVRFLNHYPAAPAPGPSRASMLTGRSPLQLASSASKPDDLQKIFAAAGYSCVSTTEGAAEAISAEAAKIIAAQPEDKPQFLTVSFPGLIPPYDQVPAKFRAMYAGAAFEDCFPAPRPAPNAREGKEMLSNLLTSLRSAAAAISALDDCVGQLLAALTRRGTLDNSLIVFASTCGSLYGRHGVWGSGYGSDPVNMYEEAVATPLIWRWPVRIPPQTRRPEWVSACDLLPSICEIAGLPPKASECSHSYAPLALGAPLPKKQM